MELNPPYSKKQEKSKADSKDDKLPSVFSYLDFRQYLKDFYEYKKIRNPSFSLAVFSQKAGLATRNYLKRVIDGERPLSSEGIPKFCLGLGLTPKEKMYFEALVNFNQTRDADSKKHYFGTLRQAAHNVPGSAIEIVQDQFDIFNHWYIIPIRELVLLRDFEENSSYIAKKMKNKISRKEAQEALETLLRLGLLVRDAHSGKLKQADPVLTYDANVINMVVRDYHQQTLDRTKEALKEDDFDSWDLRSLSLAIPLGEAKNLYEALKNFINELNVKFSTADPQGVVDVVIQLNAQIIQLTK